MDKMKIAVAGAAGRMGRELVRAIHARTDCVMTGALEQEGSLALGQDAGQLAGLGKLGVPITSDALELFAKVDAVLDFTAPQASVEFAALAANARIVHVLGTTGLGPEDEKKLAAAARHATIVTAGNMSLAAATPSQAVTIQNPTCTYRANVTACSGCSVTVVYSCAGA